MGVGGGGIASLLRTTAIQSAIVMGFTVRRCVVIHGCGICVSNCAHKSCASASMVGFVISREGQTRHGARRRRRLALQIGGAIVKAGSQASIAPVAA